MPGKDQIIGYEVWRRGVDRELRRDACIMDGRRRRVVESPTMWYELTRQNVIGLGCCARLDKMTEPCRPGAIGSEGQHVGIKFAPLRSPAMSLALPSWMAVASKPERPRPDWSMMKVGMPCRNA